MELIKASISGNTRILESAGLEDDDMEELERELDELALVDNGKLRL